MWNYNFEDKWNDITNYDVNMTEASPTSKNNTHHKMNPYYGVTDWFDIDKDWIFVNKKKN